MNRLGFSLVEMLAVVGIIMVVAGIVMPVFAGAKVAGLETAEVSHLRQLGQAREIYRADNGEQEGSFLDVVEAVPSGKQIASSSLDPEPEGRSNLISKQLFSIRGAPADYSLNFRVTFVGAHSYGWPPQLVEKFLADKPRRGWLLSYSRSVPGRAGGDFVDGLRGRYLRLLLDGSVARLGHGEKNFSIDGDDPQTGDSPFFDFADWTDSEKNEIFKEEP